MGYYIQVPGATGKAQLIADGKALIPADDSWVQAYRPRTWILMDKAAAEQCSGYVRTAATS